LLSSKLWVVYDKTLIIRLFPIHWKSIHVLKISFLLWQNIILVQRTKKLLLTISLVVVYEFSISLWYSNSLDLVVCLILNGEERPLIVHKAWMRPKSDFMHMNSMQPAIGLNGCKVQSWGYSELFHLNAKISYNSGLLF